MFLNFIWVELKKKWKSLFLNLIKAFCMYLVFLLNEFLLLKINKGNLIKNKDNINSHKNHFLIYIILMALLKGPFQSG